MITELSSFWEMNVSDTDRIAWDSKGTAHGIYFGGNFNAATTMFGSGWYRGAGTQTPYNSGGITVPGAPIAKGGSSFTYCIWVRPSSNPGDVYLGQWAGSTGTAVNERSWTLAFNTMPGRPTLTYAKTDGTTGGITVASPTVSPGALTLVCMHYNSATGQLGLSGNGTNWTTATPTAPFQPVPSGDACSHPADIYDPFYPCTLDFSHSHAQFFPTGAPVIGRTMYWNGYIPSNAELSTLYNGGSGQDATYFGLSFTPPTRPLTVTLANASFAEDANLSGQEGLYYLRPYPLKFYSSALATANGDYVWLRSTDHSTGAGGIWRGYSASPATLPTSWTQIITDSWLSTADPSSNWQQVETPYLVWNPDTSLFHLYMHAVLIGSSSPFAQATHVATSPDLSTWTWHGIALPTNRAACPGNPCYNHTGYANIVRNGTGDWEATSLLTSSEPSGTDGFIRSGIWTSTDGLSFTVDRETVFMSPIMPYRNQQNQQVARAPSLRIASADVLVASNYVADAINNFEFSNPAWPLFFHDGDGVSGRWLQDVRAYEEGGNVYVYAKWSYQQTSTVRLYTGTLAGSGGVQYTTGSGGLSALTYNGTSVIGAHTDVSIFNGTFDGSVVSLSCTNAAITDGFRRTCNSGIAGHTVFEFTFSGAGTDTLAVNACLTNSDTSGRSMSAVSMDRFMSLDATSGTLTEDATTNIGNESSVAKLYDMATYSAAMYVTEMYDLGFSWASNSKVSMSIIAPQQTSNVIANGATKCTTMSVAFGPAGGSIATAAAPGYTAFQSAYPSLLSWGNRAPVASMFMADSGNRTTNNPRGWATTTSSPDFIGAGFATARGGFLAKMQQYIDNAADITPRPQAVIWWDVEGQEFPHVFTYVGYPGDDSGSNLTVVAPEMETQTNGVALVDEAMALIKSNGFEPGITLRPHVKQGSGTVRPTNGCLAQGSTDGQVYIDTDAAYLSRGYRCQERTITFNDTTNRVVCATPGQCDLLADQSVVRLYALTGTLPTAITAGTDYYIQNWSTPDDFQISTDEAGMNIITDFSGGAGTYQMETWRGPLQIAEQEAETSYADALDVVRQQVSYARRRWGIRYFYYDSTYFKNGSAWGASDATIGTYLWSVIQAENPTCIFMPENSPSSGDTAKFVSTNNNDFKTNLTAAASRLYPPRFLAVQVNGNYVGQPANQAEVREGIGQGDMHIVNVNAIGSIENQFMSDNAAAQAINAIVAVDSDSGYKVFKAAPGTTFTFPTVMRVYFASSSGGLAASTTYCTTKATTSCYLDGVLQSAPYLELIGLQYYQIRYYDFAGNLVSNPGNYGTIQ